MLSIEQTNYLFIYLFILLVVLMTSRDETWSNDLHFWMSALGVAIGFGSVWRMSYLISENGGATFLIPYWILTFLVAIPLTFMELVVGQYFR
jgi:SNF family Na+-dependent transporter